MPTELGNPYGVQAVGTDNREGTFVDADLASVAAMHARLKVIDATLYTDAKLESMTHNDKIYAIRLNDNPTKIR